VALKRNEGKVRRGDRVAVEISTGTSLHTDAHYQAKVRFGFSVNLIRNENCQGYLGGGTTGRSHVQNATSWQEGGLVGVKEFHSRGREEAGFEAIL